MLFSLFRPAIFALDPEYAHKMSLKALGLGLLANRAFADTAMSQNIAGLDFPNPVGLAPGYDKDAEAITALYGLGFGAVEVGTLTPKPQEGNPKPRLFRLLEDQAVINRMGFNNAGQGAAIPRLAAARTHALRGPLGINIGANKDSIDRIADYVLGVTAMEPYADYLTVNISSPNTPGLRALQDRGALSELLAAVMAERKKATPVFLKVAPDLQPSDIDDIIAVAMDNSLDALIISNTTIERPVLRSRHASEAGGLSGRPLRDMAQQRLRDFRVASGGAIPLIGVGGIASGADAYARVKAGASLIQLYSAMVYAGPGLPKRILKELQLLMQTDGLAHISEAIGVDVVV